MPDVVLRDLPALRLTGFQHRGPYQQIGATFDRLMAWAGEHGLVGPQTRCFGVYYDNPRVVAPESLRAFAGLSLDSSAVPDGGAVTVDLPAGRHAVLTHKGPYAGLQATYLWFYDTWIPQSGEKPDPERPSYEEYLNNPRDLPPEEWLTHIAAPLR
ncbi:AraC family transcriptional regulator [Azospirillum doebereinerae]|uniref:GyrI-like domain-containing protein n=1 Tax=Azospirillum doebereinerae TaxID=92933 RepID=A0A433IZT9_9PROT|nr:GyrI-like domain-containing protein [Azospirillum doebereinerae]RUQ61426.1 GyrI-like domain-containing protein [Azospirillum doebereinerae]